MGLNYRRPTPKPPFAWQPSQEYEPYTKKTVAVKGLCEIDVFLSDFFDEIFFWGKRS